MIAPDLLGHGDSDKPRGDYSLGGGVALQFAYQYPQMAERLILVSSGGLGAEVMPLLPAWACSTGTTCRRWRRSGSACARTPPAARSCAA